VILQHDRERDIDRIVVQWCAFFNHDDCAFAQIRFVDRHSFVFEQFARIATDARYSSKPSVILVQLIGTKLFQCFGLWWWWWCTNTSIHSQSTLAHERQPKQALYLELCKSTAFLNHDTDGFEATVATDMVLDQNAIARGLELEICHRQQLGHLFSLVVVVL
jgi:hypothetical protein